LRIQAEQQEEAAQRKQLMMIQEADQTTSCDVSINDINVSVVLCGADFVTGHLKCDRCFFFPAGPSQRKATHGPGIKRELTFHSPVNTSGLRLRRYGFSQNSQTESW